MTPREKIDRYKEKILNCHEKTFFLARKIDSLGVLLEKGFESDGDTSLYGLGILLSGFGEELSQIYRELDRVVGKLQRFGEKMDTPQTPRSAGSGE